MNNPIYSTGTTQDGIPLFGGLWKMKTQHGFPVELSLMELQERGACPDWAEMLADAGSVELPAWEFDQAVEELRQNIPGMAESILASFKTWFARHQFPGANFPGVCRVLLNLKRDGASSLSSATG